MAKTRPSRPRAPSSASGRRRAGSRDAADRGPSSDGGKRPAGKRPAGKHPAGKRPASKRPAGKPKQQPFAVNEREQREGVRLQKFIASAGVASRRRAEELITSGLVEVNGQRVTELGTRVFPGRDRVTVRGEPIRAEDKVYFVLNKPDEVVSSAAGSVDERGRPTVLSLMHGIPQRLYPVGRLDYHSRGVMILTNDGELAAALTHPRHGVVKTYHVKFQGKLSPEQEDALREGVELDDGTVTRPLAELFAFRETEANVWYQIGLTEGLNRQIRRMGEAIDRPVLKLIRVAIGDITADGLEEGEFRPLSPTEVGQLLAAVELEPAHARKLAKPGTQARPGGRAPSKRPAGGSPPGAKPPSKPRRGPK
ncbi:MAG: pseudouridine synthase [Enhygromyxa sp.]